MLWFGTSPTNEELVAVLVVVRINNSVFAPKKKSNILRLYLRSAAVVFKTYVVAFRSVTSDILKRGGNAADAAVAIAAALSVTEPCSTGPGGDAFCLFYDGDSGAISCLNGRSENKTLIFLLHVHVVPPASSHINY